ncbi:hypothetical protein E3N88_01525 [Mikania micrantha]|uniref:Reverse transcriptase domain-containing protein n=1 Tax=Mikania micrantha TaxID=192012 RepID=A0A5N6Q1B4_9ASTR|nr:hypothetical protein E3N88_01525 [Mikania micrantha]
MKAHKCLRKGHTTVIALITEKPVAEKKIEDIPVVCEFPEVFPEDLPGLPPIRQVEFRIDLHRLKCKSYLHNCKSCWIRKFGGGAEAADRALTRAGFLFRLKVFVRWNGDSRDLYRSMRRD